MTTTQPDTQTYEVPHPDSLTMAELDEVLAATGIEIQALRTSDAGRVLAALVCWTRRRAGEQVTFDDVYRGMRMSQVRVSPVDPTPAVPSTAAD